MKPSVALALAVAVPLSLAAETSATAAEPAAAESEPAVIGKRHVDRDAAGDVSNPDGVKKRVANSIDMDKVVYKSRKVRLEDGVKKEKVVIFKVTGNHDLGEFNQRVVTLFTSGGREYKFVNATNPKTHNDLWVRKPGGEWGKFKDSEMYGLSWVSSTEPGQMKVNLPTRHFKSGQIGNVRTRAVVRHEGKKATDRVDPTSAWILKF